MADSTQDDSTAQVKADFPPALAAALLKVMAAMDTLAKGREKTGAGGTYAFASIDDFIGHVRPSLIEAEVLIIPNEAEPSRLVDVVGKDGKPMAMWWTRFAFTFVHVSGASYGPIFKTVLVHATGAQSAGAAQSYAMKQLDRGIFQIKTGDDDDPDKEKTVIRGRGENETDLQRSANRIRKEMLLAPSAVHPMDELGRVWSDNAMTLDLIKAQSQVAYDHLLGEYRRIKDQIEAAAASIPGPPRKGEEGHLPGIDPE